MVLTAQETLAFPASSLVTVRIASGYIKLYVMGWIAIETITVIFSNILYSTKLLEN